MLQLNTSNIYRQGEVDTVGATSPHVNISAIRNYALTGPPLTEQSKIANFLDESIQKADQLIVQADNTAKFLNERRCALISASVTGKIDVRTLTPRAKNTVIPSGERESLGATP
jgi:type I restriction enzyme S subunit